MFKDALFYFLITYVTWAIKKKTLLPFTFSSLILMFIILFILTCIVKLLWYATLHLFKK